MRHRVRHECEPAQNDEAAEGAVRETDQGTAKKCALHEFVPERFEQPVHLPNECVAPGKIWAPKVRAMFSSVKTSVVSPKAISFPFRKMT